MSYEQWCEDPLLRGDPLFSGYSLEESQNKLYQSKTIVEEWLNSNCYRAIEEALIKNGLDAQNSSEPCLQTTPIAIKKKFPNDQAQNVNQIEGAIKTFTFNPFIEDVEKLNISNYPVLTINTEGTSSCTDQLNSNTQDKTRNDYYSLLEEVENYPASTLHTEGTSFCTDQLNSNTQDKRRNGNYSFLKEVDIFPTSNHQFSSSGIKTTIPLDNGKRNPTQMETIQKNVQLPSRDIEKTSTSNQGSSTPEKSIRANFPVFKEVEIFRTSIQPSSMSGVKTKFPPGIELNHPNQAATTRLPCVRNKKDVEKSSISNHQASSIERRNTSSNGIKQNSKSLRANFPVFKEVEIFRTPSQPSSLSGVETKFQPGKEPDHPNQAATMMSLPDLNDVDLLRPLIQPPSLGGVETKFPSGKEPDHPNQVATTTSLPDLNDADILRMPILQSSLSGVETKFPPGKEPDLPNQAATTTIACLLVTKADKMGAQLCLVPLPSVLKAVSPRPKEEESLDKAETLTARNYYLSFSKDLEKSCTLDSEDSPSILEKNSVNISEQNSKALQKTKKGNLPFFKYVTKSGDSSQTFSPTRNQKEFPDNKEQNGKAGEKTRVDRNGGTKSRNSNQPFSPTRIRKEFPDNKEQNRKAREKTRVDRNGVAKSRNSNQPFSPTRIQKEFPDNKEANRKAGEKTRVDRNGVTKSRNSDQPFSPTRIRKEFTDNKEQNRKAREKTRVDRNGVTKSRHSNMPFSLTRIQKELPDNKEQNRKAREKTRVDRNGVTKSRHSNQPFSPTRIRKEFPDNKEQNRKSREKTRVDRNVVTKSRHSNQPFTPIRIRKEFPDNKEQNRKAREKSRVDRNGVTKSRHSSTRIRKEFPDNKEQNRKSREKTRVDRNGVEKSNKANRTSTSIKTKKGFSGDIPNSSGTKKLRKDSIVGEHSKDKNCSEVFPIKTKKELPNKKQKPSETVRPKNNLKDGKSLKKRHFSEGVSNKRINNKLPNGKQNPNGEKIPNGTQNPNLEQNENGIQNPEESKYARKLRHSRIRNNSSIPILTCYHCKYRTRSKGLLRNHIVFRHLRPVKKKKAKQKGYKIRRRTTKGKGCPFCAFVPKLYDNLTRHLREVHGIGNPLPVHKCKLCGHVSSRKSDMRIHFQALHENKTPFTCRFCSYGTVRKYRLREHMARKHSILKPILPRSPPRPSSFQITETSKVYQCSYCSFSSPEAREINVHVKFRHIKEKRFCCKYCHHVSKTSTNLIIHIKGHHAKRKKYACKRCTYVAVRPRDSKRHLESNHSKAKRKRRNCSFCLFSASTREKLHYHVMDYHKEELSVSHECSLCPLKFRSIADLKAHKLSIHTEKKTVSCPDCDYSASSFSFLQLHIKRNHPPFPVKKFNCTHCDSKFSTNDYLTEHINQNHQASDVKSPRVRIMKLWRPSRLSKEHIPDNTSSSNSLPPNEESGDENNEIPTYSTQGLKNSEDDETPTKVLPRSSRTSTGKEEEQYIQRSLSRCSSSSSSGPSTNASAAGHCLQELSKESEESDEEIIQLSSALPPHIVKAHPEMPATTSLLSPVHIKKEPQEDIIAESQPSSTSDEKNIERQIQSTAALCPHILKTSIFNGTKTVVSSVLPLKQENITLSNVIPSFSPYDGMGNICLQTEATASSISLPPQLPAKREALQPQLSSSKSKENNHEEIPALCPHILNKSVGTQLSSASSGVTSSLIPLESIKREPLEMDIEIPPKLIIKHENNEKTSDLHAPDEKIRKCTDIPNNHIYSDTCTSCSLLKKKNTQKLHLSEKRSVEILSGGSAMSCLVLQDHTREELFENTVKMSPQEQRYTEQPQLSKSPTLSSLRPTYKDSLNYPLPSDLPQEKIEEERFQTISALCPYISKETVGDGSLTPKTEGFSSSLKSIKREPLEEIIKVCPELTDGNETFSGHPTSCLPFEEVKVPETLKHTISYNTFSNSRPIKQEDCKKSPSSSSLSEEESSDDSSLGSTYPEDPPKPKVINSPSRSSAEDLRKEPAKKPIADSHQLINAETPSSLSHSCPGGGITDILGKSSPATVSSPLLSPPNSSLHEQPPSSSSEKKSYVERLQSMSACPFISKATNCNGSMTTDVTRVPSRLSLERIKIEPLETMIKLSPKSTEEQGPSVEDIKVAKSPSSPLYNNTFPTDCSIKKEGCQKSSSSSTEESNDVSYSSSSTSCSKIYKKARSTELHLTKPARGLLLQDRIKEELPEKPPSPENTPLPLTETSQPFSSLSEDKIDKETFQSSSALCPHMKKSIGNGSSITKIGVSTVSSFGSIKREKVIEMSPKLTEEQRIDKIPSASLTSYPSIEEIKVNESPEGPRESNTCSFPTDCPIKQEDHEKTLTSSSASTSSSEEESSDESSSSCSTSHSDNSKKISKESFSRKASVPCHFKKDRVKEEPIGKLINMSSKLIKKERFEETPSGASDSYTCVKEIGKGFPAPDGHAPIQTLLPHNSTIEKPVIETICLSSSSSDESSNDLPNSGRQKQSSKKLSPSLVQSHVLKKSMSDASQRPPSTSSSPPEEENDDESSSEEENNDESSSDEENDDESSSDEENNDEASSDEENDDESSSDEENDDESSSDEENDDESSSSSSKEGNCNKPCPSSVSPQICRSKRTGNKTCSTKSVLSSLPSKAKNYNNLCKLPTTDSPQCLKRRKGIESSSSSSVDELDNGKIPASKNMFSVLLKKQKNDEASLLRSIPSLSKDRSTTASLPSRKQNSNSRENDIPSICEKLKQQLSAYPNYVRVHCKKGDNRIIQSSMTKSYNMKQAPKVIKLPASLPSTSGSFIPTGNSSHGVTTPSSVDTPPPKKGRGPRTPSPASSVKSTSSSLSSSSTHSTDD